MERGVRFPKAAATGGGMATDGEVKTITTVDRAADVLTLFARLRDAPVGGSEDAEQLDVSMAAVRRRLTALAPQGRLRLHREGRGDALGPTVLTRGLARLERIDIRRVALPVMRDDTAAT